MKRIIHLEIEVDPDVEEMYPNYKTNFRTMEDFTAFIRDTIAITETESFGYSIKITKDKVVKGRKKNAK